MSHQGRYWRMLIVAFVLLNLIPPSPTAACGWWGDGEASDSDDAIEIGADGRPVTEPKNLKSMKLPGKMGYGISIFKPDKAEPYLRATFGQPVSRIDELKEFGFRSVIDLGTPSKTARLHRGETENLGMKYFNITIEGDMPTEQQSGIFNDIVLNAQNGPLLVYASKAKLLGVMWALYRMSQGVPTEFAILEGRAFGLTSAQEKNLRVR